MQFITHLNTTHLIIVYPIPIDKPIQIDKALKNIVNIGEFWHLLKNPNTILLLNELIIGQMTGRRQKESLDKQHYSYTTSQSAVGYSVVSSLLYLFSITF